MEKINKKIADTVSISREEYEKLINSNTYLTNENTELKQKVNWLEECIKLRNKKIFGSSSEQVDSNQLHFDLFNEAEYAGDINGEEPKLEEVKAHFRKQRVSTKDKLPEDIDVEVIEHRINNPEDLLCSKCGTQLHEIGSEVVREELKVIPAKAVLVKHVRYSYGCRNCEQNDIASNIVKAHVPNGPIKKSFASPEILAYIMSQKYVLDIPLYRQEQDFKRKDILLSRQTMSNWVIKASHNLLTPIYDLLHTKFVNQDIIHCDETEIQVLKEKDKPAKSKSYMWLYRSGRYEDRQIALYDYQPSRSAKHVISFLDGFCGYCHVDGYAAYRKLPKEVTLIGCFAHIRRKFFESVSILTEEQKKTSKAVIGLDYCNKIFAIEAEIKDMDLEAKQNIRKAKVVPLLSEFLTWLKFCNATPNSHLGRAITYTLNQWGYFENYLLDARLEASNNRAEHLAKQFAVCRKNFLFCNTPNGATESATTLSIIATAMANNLDPYEYLTYIFKIAPNIDLTDSSEVEKLLPWNVTLK